MKRVRMKDEGGRMKQQRAPMRARSSFIPHPSSLFRRGYSFTEVMFAVVVLGIGFIMIAAMFPVALSQSGTTAEETTAATLARGAVTFMESIANENSMRPTEPAGATTPAPVKPFSGIYDDYTTVPWEMKPDASGDELFGSWEAVRGNLIIPADTRMAFVPLYSRESPIPGMAESRLAKLIIIVVRTRERSRFDAADVNRAANSSLMAREVEVAVQDNVGGTGTDWVTFTDGDFGAVAEGTYVIISNHGAAPASTGVAATPIGYYNGRVFKTGLKAIEPRGGIDPPDNTWELLPGNDFTPDRVYPPVAGAPMLFPAAAVAYVVGREDNPATPGIDYRGASMGVSSYATFITVKP